MFFLLTALFLFPNNNKAKNEKESFQLIIENNSDWCSVDIYGMGKSSSADMVSFFVNGKKKQIEKIYNGQSKLENDIRIIKISNEPSGICKVSILKGDIIVAGPWINESLSTINVEDKEFSDPWNTKYFYFYTSPLCNPSGKWVSTLQDNIIKISESQALYSGETIWIPSGDRFSFDSFIAGNALIANWKHSPSSSTGILEGEFSEDCSILKITNSTGNFDWSDITLNRDDNTTLQTPSKTTSLSGEWYYANGDGLVKISAKGKNDYSAEILWVPDQQKFKVNIKLIGNLTMGTWFDSKGVNSGTFTGHIVLDEDNDTAIEITESTGSLQWSGYTWLRKKADKTDEH